MIHINDLENQAGRGLLHGESCATTVKCFYLTKEEAEGLFPGTLDRVGVKWFHNNIVEV
jgi:hypothetical protein